MKRQKYLATVLLQFHVEGEDVGEAMTAAEGTRFHEKIGNLRETKHILINEIKEA